MAPPQSPGPVALDHLVGTCRMRNGPSLQPLLSSTFSIASHVGAAVRAQHAFSIMSADVRQKVIRGKEMLLAKVDAVDAQVKKARSVNYAVT